MKRMGKQLVGMTAAVLLAAWSFPAAIVNAEGFTGEYERLIDMADLLTYEEESELLETLNEISERQKMDIVLITSEDMDGYSDIQEYADDLYDYCDYGYGANRDGLLLLISMAERDWYISTCGYGITAFTDAGISYLGSAMKEDPSSGNYAKKGSMQLATQQDLFLYSKVDRVKKPEKDSSGSSTHTSSGTTHGGGGGKF